MICGFWKKKREILQINLQCRGQPVVPNLGNKTFSEAKCYHIVAIKFPGFGAESSVLRPVLISKPEQRKRKTLFLLSLCVLNTIEQRWVSLDLLNSRNYIPTLWDLVNPRNMFFILCFFLTGKPLDILIKLTIYCWLNYIHQSIGKA